MQTVSNQTPSRPESSDSDLIAAASVYTLLTTGLQQQQAGQLEQAEALYRRVLQQEPQNSTALHLLGLVAKDQGQYEQSLTLLRQSIQYDATVPSTYNHLGNVLKEMGDLSAAVTSYQEALRLKPDYAEAHNNLGTAYREQDKDEDALTCYRDALHFQPDYADAHYNLGVLFHQHGQFESALSSYQEALRLRPEFLEAHNNLGTVLREIGQIEAAIEAYREALRLQPHFIPAYINLSIALKAQGHIDEAIATYRDVLRCQPDSAEAHYNLGNALKEQGQLETAIEHYQQALRVSPKAAEVHFNLGLAYLLSGQFNAGWPEYEWRFQRQDVPYPCLPQPRWDGSPFEHQTLLVHSEQGLGDTLFLMRYLPQVQALGGRVRFACQPELVKLLQSSSGFDEIIAWPPDPPPHTPMEEPFDLHISIMSLPALFETTEAIIPASIPYLAPNPDLVNSWHQSLSLKPGFRVGIVWAGNPEHPNDTNRSCRLIDFARLAHIPGISLLSLQIGPAAAQAISPPFGISLENLGSHLDDFSITAAIISNLDLIVTVDTAVAHLAGAMGKSVWTLLPFIPDWRWMMHRSDSPWYPSMRLYRQPKVGDWAAVFEQVTDDLHHLIASQQPQGHTAPCTQPAPAPSAIPPAAASVTLRRPSILFSTTCMWNPGDDFIRFGVHNLLQDLIGSFNAVVYNRHPDLHHSRLHLDQPITLSQDDTSIQVNLHEILQSQHTPRDNSWHPGLPMDIVDLAIFAGTPEWMGPMVAPLVDSLLETATPAIYLGIGAFEGNQNLTFDQLSPADQQLLKRSLLITTRDATCAKIIAPLPLRQLPCPALFAAPYCRQRTEKKRFALSIQGIKEHNGQRIDVQTWHYSIHLFKALEKHYDCTLICHYLDELSELKPIFGDQMPFFYSHDPQDYLDFYDQFDLTVTTRVHGAGICASLGVPGFVLSHSTRSATVQGFLAERINPSRQSVNDALKQIDQFDVAAASSQLCLHKEAVRHQYKAVLQPALFKAELLEM